MQRVEDVSENAHRFDLRPGGRLPLLLVLRVTDREGIVSQILPISTIVKIICLETGADAASRAPVPLHAGDLRAQQRPLVQPADQHQSDLAEILWGTGSARCVREGFHERRQYGAFTIHCQFGISVLL